MKTAYIIGGSVAAAATAAALVYFVWKPSKPAHKKARARG